MLNKNEMNGKANAVDVDVDLLVAGIGEMLDGIRHDRLQIRCRKKSV